jgi:hypothetical protein
LNTLNNIRSIKILQPGFNNFKYIEKRVFENVLYGSSRNFLDMRDNPINCTSREPFEWILSNTITLYWRYVLFATCSDGRDFWDIG